MLEIIRYILITHDVEEMSDMATLSGVIASLNAHPIGQNTASSVVFDIISME